MAYRGFKTYASAIASDFRRELGLGELDPLDPTAAATNLEIPVVPLEDLHPYCEFKHIETMRRSGTVFSACTVFRGSRRIIVYNDAHSLERTASNIAHELSHALLQHPPHDALSAAGCRFIDREEEEEAAFLSGVLLVPDAVALWIVRSNVELTRGAKRYGVSVEMLRYRINVTGARRRISRSIRRSA